MRDEWTWGDETRCDACGQPTPRPYPPLDVELCDACWRAREHAEDIKRLNDATYQRAVARFFGLAQ